MESYQIFALFLGISVFLSWIYKQKNINMQARLVDEDKIERKRLLDLYFMLYFLIVISISVSIWNAAAISKYIYLYLGKDYAPGTIATNIFIFSNLICLVIMFFIKRDKKNNKKVIAKPNSSYKLNPKKLNIGVIDGHFLNSKKQSDLNYVIRIDDFTIQKVRFNKESILLKKEYIKNIFKYNRFEDEDFNFISKIEVEINKINEYNFNPYPNMEKRIIQLIKAILSQKKYTFPFGQIKQYSTSFMIEETLYFLQEIQENRYSDSSLPYLLHFEKYIK